MNYSPPFCSNRLRTALFGLVLVQALAPHSGFCADPPKSAPAKVEGAVKEAELATITLQPEAAKRLGIETAPVEESIVHRTRLFGGEVVSPPGGSLVISAPLTGRVMAADDGLPIVGARVQRGRAVFRLWPVIGSEHEVLSPGDRLARLRANVDIEAARVEVDGQVAKAQVAVNAARQRVERARELRERSAGSERAFDDARAEFDTAEATLNAAKQRLAFLGETSVEPDLSSVPSLAVSSPIDGMLQQVSAATDQLVTAGTPLFTVTNLDRVWIRVPVYVGEANSISANTAVVTLPGEVTAHKSRTAARIPGPASANVSASTVDLFFELANDATAFRPGQRVMVTVPASKEVSRLRVPWSAVVFDIHGHAWVYETTQANQFSRRRVELERADGDWAILRRGIKAGSQVVAAGAAELYGTEFGVGK